MKKRITLASLLTLALGLALWQTQTPDAPFTGHGDSASLGGVFNRWKTAYESRGGSRVLHLGLSPSKALSRAASGATGRAALDLADGRFRVDVDGLPGDAAYEVWLLDNHTAAQGAGAAPAKSQSHKLGTLTGKDGQLSLSTVLDRDRTAGFTLDAITVARADEAPEAGGVLRGSPSLFHRLYYSDRAWTVTQIGAPGAETPAPLAGQAFEMLLPKVAHAASKAPATTQTVLEALIAKGHDLFTEETFGGNGRTCATCHRPDNNHTIDPKYIASLPKTDPLFVAETNPALADLEKPLLLRQFGLFVANVDGFDRPPVMRSASHLLALSTSLAIELKDKAGEFQEDTDYFAQHNSQAQAIGWSQDGAPDSGSLRDFAKGAIRQHLPKTLNRVEGADFRLPTEEELDALEAYMLSLGRTTDVNLAALKFKSAIVERGKALFDQKQNPVDANGKTVFGQSANCNGCHQNAGAVSSTTAANPTRDTGIERMRDQLHRLADPTVAYDGGFGQIEQNDCGPDFNATCYSDGSTDPRGVRPANHPRLNRFNTPPLVEAADTGPFFHNHSIGTLEETVAFYNTDAFNNSPGAFTSSGKNRQMRLDSSQVHAVALFLRYLNVLENIRSANALAEKAMTLKRAEYKEMVHLAMADTEDAIEVIRDGVYIPYPDALANLELALKFEKLAMASTATAQRKQQLQKAIDRQKLARGLIVEE
ncbi:hypothetical protein [Methylomagnum sp.]